MTNPHCIPTKRSCRVPQWYGVYICLSWRLNCPFIPPTFPIWWNVRQWCKQVSHLDTQDRQMNKEKNDIPMRNGLTLNAGSLYKLKFVKRDCLGRSRAGKIDVDFPLRTWTTRGCVITSRQFLLLRGKSSTVDNCSRDDRILVEYCDSSIVVGTVDRGPHQPLKS